MDADQSEECGSIENTEYVDVDPQCQLSRVSLDVDLFCNLVYIYLLSVRWPCDQRYPIAVSRTEVYIGDAVSSVPDSTLEAQQN